MEININKKINSGFTLLETLLYVAIVVIVAGLVIGTFITILQIQNQSTAARDVSEEGRFVLERISREVRDASLIDISTSTPVSKLVLRTASGTRDYVAVYSSGTAIYIDEGQLTGTTTSRLTTSKVIATSTTGSASDLTFTRLYDPPAKDAVQVSFTLAFNTTDPKSVFVKTFSDIFSRISSANFDAGLMPAADNSFNIGATSTILARWKNARFSGILSIGLDNSRDLVDVASSDRLILGPTDASQGGRLKLLGVAPQKYSVLDNYLNNLRIITAPAGSGNEILEVASSTGAVTIGNQPTSANMQMSVPSEKLEVRGNIISKGTAWTVRSATANSWSSVTYGNGLFVAVAISGSSNRAMYSSDGINWKTSFTAVNNKWSAITYGNGLFVAVAADGAPNQVMTSPDGVNWTVQRTPVDNSWTGIAYGNGIFVAVSDSGINKQLMTSPDGINWTAYSTPTNAYWDAVAYGNGLFVAVAYGNPGNQTMISTDGINWTTYPAATNLLWNGITYGNGRFVAIANSGTGNRVMYSNIGCNVSSCSWSSSATPDLGWSGVTYGNGLFAAVATDGSPNQVMTSPDGVSWTLRSTGSNSFWYEVTYGNGLFVTVARTSSGTSCVSGGATNCVMTSGKMDYPLTPTNNIYQGGMVIMGPGNSTLGIGTTTPEGALHVTQGATIIGGFGNVTRQDTQTGALFLDTNNQPIMGKTFSGFNRPLLNVNNSDQIDIGSNDIKIKGIRLLSGNALSNGIIAMSTNGSEQLRIDANGNIGIGTTNLQSTLHIAGTGTRPPRLSFFDSGSALSAANPAWALRADANIGGAGNGMFRIESTADYSNYANRLIINSSGNVGIVTSVPPAGLGTNWVTATPLPPTAPWQSVAAGKNLSGQNLFVAVANGTGVRSMYSYNGVNWTTSGINTSVQWQSVAYGTPGGTPRFVAVGNSSIVAYSSDGLSWGSVDTSLQGLPSNLNWSSIAYSKRLGRFVAVSSQGLSTQWRVMYSSDGQNWFQPAGTPSVALQSNYNNAWRSVTYSEDQGLFVAVSDNTGAACTIGVNQCAMTSSDGINWTASPTPTRAMSWRSVTYGNGTFVAVASYGSVGDSGQLVMTSKSGTLWATSTTPFSPTGDLTWTSVTYGKDSNGNGQYVAVASGCPSLYCVMTSSDGIGWSMAYSGVNNNSQWQSLAYADYIYVAVSQNNPRVMTSGGLVIGLDNPLQKLQVLGDIRLGTSGSNGCVLRPDGITATTTATNSAAGTCSSDLRLKKNLIPLSGSLDKLIQLEPTYFNWRADEYPELHLNGETKNLGLIAQDVEKTFPELVGVGDNGFKTVNYGIDLLMNAIEAVKELKIKNNLLKDKLHVLEEKHHISP